MNTSDRTATAQWKAVSAMVPPRQHAQGGTLLLVEDSHVASDSIRLMFRGAGARLRRVDSLRAAQQHLDLYTPDAVIVDIGLPDGCGLDLIAELDRRRPRVGLIVATSGQPDLADSALDAGADHFLPKPIASVQDFRGILAPVFFNLRHHNAAMPTPTHDSAALRDDVYMACDLLQGSSAGAQRAYALQFIDALGRSLGDSALMSAVGAARESGRVTELALMLRQRLRDQPMI
ncbi:response regulator transcription factor [Roseinatronobacter sp. NSM]|uniref:response regulator transcription factor n=1 Tax=Roseinatronobacter sp. NSM TaxID=3457785 RepID=UPI004035EAC3